MSEHPGPGWAADWLLGRVFATSRKRYARSDCCDACVRAKDGTDARVLGLIKGMR